MRHASRVPDLLRQRCNTSAAHLQSFSLPPRPHTYITPPELHSSTPTHLQRASRALEANTYTPAAHLPSSRASYLYTSTSPTLVRSRASACVSARYQYLCTSKSTRLQRTSGTLEANTSTSARLQRTSRAPGLHTSTPSRVSTSPGPQHVLTRRASEGILVSPTSGVTRRNTTSLAAAEPQAIHAYPNLEFVIAFAKKFGLGIKGIHSDDEKGMGNKLKHSSMKTILSGSLLTIHTRAEWRRRALWPSNH